jgi:hypothetical protein
MHVRQTTMVNLPSPLSRGGAQLQEWIHKERWKKLATSRQLVLAYGVHPISQTPLHYARNNELLWTANTGSSRGILHSPYHNPLGYPQPRQHIQEQNNPTDRDKPDFESSSDESVTPTTSATSLLTSTNRTPSLSHARKKFSEEF